MNKRMIMPKAFVKRMKKNEAGFTFIELLIATVMSLAILGLLAHLFRAQQKDFATQTGLNTMQANGRAATEFISRSVQNAGFKVKRGTRFLAASDHSLTAVYDANNDDVIQNDEVITYALANVWNGTADETTSFVARFDVDGNGSISSTENPTITVDMTTTAPPFNLYKVTPNAAGSGIIRSLVARNIDNMVIRYYDRDGKLLPRMLDTDADGIGDLALDADDNGIPDSGNWNYDFTAAELNDIRKVEIDLIARSRKPNPRELTRTGIYVQGSLAALTSGSTTYSDTYLREDFTAKIAPRNLVMAPWGSVDIVATPASVDCPGTATILATLLDKNGDPIAGTTMNFTATGGATVTLGTASPTSDVNGEGTTTLTYDYSSPYLTSTVSASAIVDDGSGNLNPIYNATPVGFSFGGQGFIDHFDGAQTQPWSPLVPGGDDFEIDAEEFRSPLTGPGAHVGSLNGCSNWKDYVVQTNVLKEPGSFPNGEFFGIILRSQDENNYYWARVDHQGNERLIIGKRVAGTDTSLTTGPNFAFADNTTYTLKAQIQGTEIKFKIWAPADPADPAADEPTAWDLPVTDTDFTNGEFGVEARDNIFRFDDISLENAPPII